MDITQITALIGAAASLLCTLVVGALTFFIKKTLSSLENADKKNAERIEKVEERLNDLKADLPLVYVTREDYIRVMNRVEDKLDQILYGSNTPKGKEE
jgi:flagellar capping protein FliD|nr:MAG TPA: SMODS and SLOG-associating 2TM effector domain family 4 [Caudoviricetes sp.]